MNRPPIVAVLGHVDHGKSTLLDTLRKSRITAGEAGGITQSIGAYELHLPGGKSITFIDTPGHEAFAKMRERGAAVADIAILVVAANDGVKPQTIEAWGHIHAAKTPTIVAINKIDLAEANPEMVKAQLSEAGIAVEGYGGDIPVVAISAKEGTNIPELLDMISLVYEMREVKADPLAALEAPVIESRRDQHTGPMVSVVVKNGTLKVGDQLWAANVEGKAKAIIDENNQRVQERLPGQPGVVLGFKDLPPVGSVVTSKRSVDQSSASQGKLPQPSSSESPETIKVLLKADAQGTLQALEKSLDGGIEVIATSVGEINESDVLLALSTKSLIIGFRTKPTARALHLAEHEKVTILTDQIIYKLIEAIEELKMGKRPLEATETGRATILKVFPMEGGAIAGCKVESGKISTGDTIKLMRGEKLISEGTIKSIKQRVTTITEAKAGEECGILLAGKTEENLKFAPQDSIIAFKAS